MHNCPECEYQSKELNGLNQHFVVHHVTDDDPFTTEQPLSQRRILDAMQRLTESDEGPDAPFAYRDLRDHVPDSESSGRRALNLLVDNGMVDRTTAVRFFDETGPREVAVWSPRVWVVSGANNMSARVYHVRPDCNSLRRGNTVNATTREELAQRDADEWRPCTHTDCCGSRSGQVGDEDGRQCPYCGQDIKRFRHHLPCDGVEEGDVDA